MWNWFRNKLGIVDYRQELIDLNVKIYELIKITSECLHLLETEELNNKKISMLKSLEFKLNQQFNEVNHNIKAIPKEITVKNIVSI